MQWWPPAAKVLGGDPWCSECSEDIYINHLNVVLLIFIKTYAKPNVTQCFLYLLVNLVMLLEITN